MMVNGPLEIYSTVIGARLYDNIFNILASTGLAFLPFLGLFFHNITSPYESEIANGADTSLRRVVIHFLILVFCIMIFAAPTHKLNVTSVTYKASPDAMISRYGDTGTTYDEVFSDLHYSDFRIPLGLAFVLGGASGITNAAIVSLPYATDVQKIKSVIDTTRLTPELAQEVSRFRDECFATARAKFNNTHPKLSEYKDTMNMYGGQSDLSWIGSHVFQKLYYADLYPSNPISSFPNQNYPYHYQDYNHQQAQVDTPKGGYPSCLAWWNDAEFGLQKRLVQSVKDHQPSNPHLSHKTFFDGFREWLSKVKTYGHIGSQVTAEDVITHDLLYDANSDGGFGRNNTQWMDSGIHKFSSNIFADQQIATDNVIAVAGQGIHRFFGGIDRSEVDQEIPILQAILMTLCLALGPIILVLGSYRVNVVFSYYFILSSIISITFIEKLLHYLEMSLHASQSYGLGAVANVWVMYNVFTKLYFYAPILYLMLMSICGVSLGNSVSQFFNSSVSGQGSGIAKKVGGAIAGVFGAL